MAAEAPFSAAQARGACSHGGFRDFPIYQHRPCEAPADQARGFYADSEPYHARIGVERTYFSKAGRRTEFRRRIEEHFELLLERLVEERRVVR